LVMRVFILAINIALAVVIVTWLHSPPVGYQWSERKPISAEGSPASQKQGLQKSNNEQAENGWWERLRTDPNATFAGFVALFTLALVILTAIQGWLIYAAQRANLIVEPFGIHVWSTKPDEFVAHVRIKNVGYLAARGVSWSLHIEFDGNRIRRHFPIRNAHRPAPAMPRDTTLVRGTERKKRADMVVPSNHAEWFCYVWGEVRYIDGVLRRSALFCHRYNCEVRPDDGPCLIGRDYGRHHDYGNA
jgi:hypothetical protein